MSIKIYCDGSTKIKNKKGVENIGGFAYVVYDTESGYIIDVYNQLVKNTTNNAMELCALYYAISHYGTPEEWNCPTIYSDSKYAINCATVWNKTWKENDWINSAGKQIENLDIIKLIDEVLSSDQYNVNIEYCPGHSGIKGNELADALAKGDITPAEVFYSDVKNKIPNRGCLTPFDWKYKDNPEYWVKRVEHWIKKNGDNDIYINKDMKNWYYQYKEKINKNDEK